MNLYYLELKTYLEEVEHHPAVVMDKDYIVFRSEEKLYGNNKKINHRLHSKSQTVYGKLFEQSEHDSSILYPLLLEQLA